MRNIQIAHALLDKALAVVGVENRKVAVVADQVDVAAKQPREDRVEGADPEAGGAASFEDAVDTVAHLARRLVGKGKRENVLRRNPDVADQVRDAEGNDARLARTRARKHHHGAFGGKHGLALNVVEFPEKICQSC